MRTSLYNCHGKLSELSFAVKLALEPLPVDITIEWRNGTHLTVKVECYERHKQMVVDRLKHGALHGKYDYRFKSISYLTMPAHPWDWTIVTAWPDMEHDDKKLKVAA